MSNLSVRIASHIKPIRIGAYMDESGPVYWDGKDWYIITEEEMFTGDVLLSVSYKFEQKDYWWGLAQEPK